MPAPAADTRWLTDEQQTSWRGLLRMYQLLFEGLDKQLRAQTGIPHAYYVILAMLSESPDTSMRMSDLAEATTTSASRTSHAVSALEERGWISRTRSASDRRGQVAQLTDEGMRVLVETAPTHVEQVQRLLFDHLSDAQVRQLTAITRAVNADQ